MQSIRNNWFSNIRADILAGILVALALIPEAIAFSIIAGVDPKVGLYASFSIAVIISFIGGRPAMISAATGAMALVMITLVKEHGLEYLLAATVLTGILQIIASFCKVHILLQFISRAVMIGFLNALAILIFVAQLPEFNGASWHMYIMVALGLGIIYGLPYITKAIPSTLVAIIVLTIVSLYVEMDLRVVGDMGELPSTLPMFLIPNIPWTFETLMIILPYAITLSVVGLLESLMTAVIIDDLTDTKSNKKQECFGQGVANFVTGFFGGMAGCAMIGQSVINVKSGGRTRLSTLVSGAFLLFFILVLADWVKQIPMAALVSVMIMVSVGIFSWSSVTHMNRVTLSANITMLATVAFVVATNNLALGVLVGVLLSAIFFAFKMSRLLQVKSELLSEKGDNIHDTHRIYYVSGEIFFVSSMNFISHFDLKEFLNKVSIDMTNANFWDMTGVDALHRLIVKFRCKGTQIIITGLTQKNKNLLTKLHSYDHDTDGVKLVTLDNKEE